jgi:hypothetical protein
MRWARHVISKREMKKYTILLNTGLQKFAFTSHMVVLVAANSSPRDGDG